MKRISVAVIGRVLALPLALAAAWACVRVGWPREQASMAAIVVLAAVLWVTEALPIFATALLVIAAEVFLLTNPLESPAWNFSTGATPSLRTVLGAIADPVLVLFFSGFVLARAAVKERVDVLFGGWLLHPFSSGPVRMLFGIIGVAALFSMWMSNTATAAFMLTLVAPLIAQLPAEATFRKALLLAVPFACNIGGMGTPIASPPNAIALGYLNRAGHHVSFGEWMLFAVPLVLVLLTVLGLVLLKAFPPGETRGFAMRKVERLSARGIITVVVFVVTVLLWITEAFHGVSSSVVALVPLTVLLVAGVIGRLDINELDWDVLLLIAGGFALGWGMSVTQLDQRIVAWLPGGESGSGLLVTALVVATLTLGTFLSNTAVANLLLPIGIAAAVATAQQAVGMAIALTASLTMALPISTPPNAMAFARGDLAVADMVRVGALVGVIGGALVLAGAWWFVR